MAIIDLNIKCLIVQLWNIKDWLEDLLGWLQGNARRVHERGCVGNGYFGKLSKFGLALLWCIIIVLIFVYIHAIILGILLLWYISDDWIFHNMLALILFLICRRLQHKYDCTFWVIFMVGCFSCNCWTGYVL